MDPVVDRLAFIQLNPLNRARYGNEVHFVRIRGAAPGLLPLMVLFPLQPVPLVLV